MSQEISEGIRIMAVGIVGVFANLVILMYVVKGLGRIFGKKPKTEKKA
jgi:Na+-transporting methylmalonyl-CoA/oxaloacetate decarboxylase gamma subunit